MSHIMVYGNPCDGFRFVGPFSTKREAYAYIVGEQEGDKWIAELDAPASLDNAAPARLGDEIVEQERSMEAVNDGFERLAKSIESIPTSGPKPTAVEDYAAWLARQPKQRTS